MVWRCSRSAGQFRKKSRSSPEVRSVLQLDCCQHAGRSHSLPIHDWHVPGIWSLRTSPYRLCLRSSDFIINQASCFVDHKFARHATNDDHIPLVAEGMFPVLTRRPIMERRTTSYSRDAARHEYKLGPRSRPEACQHVHEPFLQLPCLPVELEATSHVFIYNESVPQIVAEEFPPESNVPRAPCMSEETFALPRQRSFDWAHLNVLGRKIGNAVVWFIVNMLAFNANLAPKPRWSKNRGPASTMMCMQQLYEKQ